LETLARCPRSQVCNSITRGQLRSRRTATRCCGTSPLISRSIDFYRQLGKDPEQLTVAAFELLAKKLGL